MHLMAMEFKQLKAEKLTSTVLEDHDLNVIQIQPDSRSHRGFNLSAFLQEAKKGLFSFLPLRVCLNK